MPTLKLPSQLATLANGQRTLSVAGNTVAEVFENLDAIAPLVRSQVLDVDGNVRRFVGLFVSNKQVKSVRDATPLSADSAIAVVMAVAGG